ncbi:unnamed protein product [Miscanthus lutarioriparius]|uniref:Thaumatin-like protein n=1 Tax=Miscanthus lutarioriparius TaxID=422564 RepID=A0A811RGH2_9POAL|nr:unnamed protein product [Miscanthus lutarioriparius]
MASKSISLVLFLLLAAFTAGASAATFTITNNCGYTVWPAGIPVGGGTQLDQGHTWIVDVPTGTSGRFWGRTGCSFNVEVATVTYTVDCAGALSCTVSGQPPATLAEYTIGGTGNNQDYYDISVVDGYNLAMAFSCSTGVGLVCTDPSCPDAYQYPTDDTKTMVQSAGSNPSPEVPPSMMSYPPPHPIHRIHLRVALLRRVLRGTVRGGGDACDGRRLVVFGVLDFM